MIWLGLEGCSFQAGSMVLISDEEKRRSGAPPRRARRPGSAGPRLGGGASRCSSWDRSLHKEDWKHGSIGKLDPKEGGIGYGRKRDYRDGTQPPLSNSFLSSSLTSAPHYAAHTAASSARISRSVDRYQGEAFQRL